MLQAPLKRGIFFVLVSTSALCVDAQIHSTTSLQFNGDPGTRRIDGLAAPLVGNAAVTVNGALETGGFAWSTATMTVDTVVLDCEPPLNAYADGTLLRFAAPVQLQGNLFLKAQGLSALPLVRTDGLALNRGQVPQGYITEIIQVNGRFYVMNTTGTGCPSGFLQAHENLCIQANISANMLYYQGVERCASLGGKLCNWDEYLAACTLLQGQLLNQFANWEWIDDSSNHGHGADQAGRFTCLSQRHYGLIPITPAYVRCCYHPR